MSDFSLSGTPQVDTKLFDSKLSRGSPVYAFFHRLHRKRKFSAADVLLSIDRLIRAQRRAAEADRDLHINMTQWLESLPSGETKQMVREFLELFSAVSSTYGAQAQNLLRLKAHMGAIAERELRQHELWDARYQLNRRYDSTSLKHGSNAQATQLVEEEIQENKVQLTLAQSNLARVSEKTLIEAFSEYVKYVKDLTHCLNVSGLHFDRIMHNFRLLRRELPSTTRTASPAGPTATRSASPAVHGGSPVTLALPMATDLREPLTPESRWQGKVYGDVECAGWGPHE